MIMPDSYVKGNEEAQKRLVDAVIRSIFEGKYSKLIVLLEMLAMSFEDYEFRKKIIEIRKRTISKCGIEFGTFEKLYHDSFSVDPRRRVVIRNGDDMRRVPFPEVRAMFEDDVIRPSTDIAVELVSRISRDKSTVIRSMIAGVTSSASETVSDIKSRKLVIGD